MTDDAKPEAGDAEHHGDPHRSGHREQGADPGRQRVEVPEKCRGVRPYAEEGAVTEGDEAEAAHEGPGLADEGPDEDLDGHVEHVLLHAPHGDEGGDEE